MNMDKAFAIQNQVRQNVNTFQTYMTDLQNWEAEMKRKEAALSGACEQDLPPVRSKVKKEKPVVPPKKKPERRISSSDYSSWEKFDVDKACEEVDMEDVGPASLDGKKSQQTKLEKLREEAQYEKERGNTFVKQEKWDEAISCYNRAIELVKDDAIYFANRGLCHLKKDSLHQAETDCSEALKLDPTYVKALQRRATAREKLGSLRAASQDLAEVLKLEPQNNAARTQLVAIKARMGTKGVKSKSSPLSTPTLESKPFSASTKAKIIELDDEPAPVAAKDIKKTEPILTADEKWRKGIGEKITVIVPVKKPPHMRSKTPLKPVAIDEIQIGKTEPEKKPATRLKIIEIEDDQSHGDSNNNANIETDSKIIGVGEGDRKVGLKNGTSSPESEKLASESMKELVNESKETFVGKLQPPVNSVQFMSEWKYLKGKGEARSEYLSLIDPSKLSSIFDNALESEVLSELLLILKENKAKFRQKTVAAYLKGLVKVKRFAALTMFLSKTDKELVHKLLVHCRTAEGCSDDEIADLKNKFEL